MPLLERLKNNKIDLTVRKRTTDTQILDAIMVKKYPEIRDALDTGYTWMQVYEALKEELEAEGVWNQFWGSPKVHSSYMAYRRFKSIEEAGIKYEKGELTCGK